MSMDGKLLWRRDFPLTPFAKHKFNSFASATPCIDAEAAFDVVWNEPDHYFLAALDHDGAMLWAAGLRPVCQPARLRDFAHRGGRRGHPRRRAGRQEFVPGSERDGKASSWRWMRGPAPRFGRRRAAGRVVAYSTPCVRESKNGKRSIIFNSQAHGIYAVDPDTGKVLWDYEQAFDKRSVSSPFIAGDIIFGSSGSGGGGNQVTAIKAGDAAAWGCRSWHYQIEKSAPYVPTGVAVGDLAWFWSDGGVLTCIDAATGDIRFQRTCRW